jgi:DNA-binding CsgD family transcriptional regulator
MTYKIIEPFLIDLNACDDVNALEATFGRWLATYGIQFFAYNMHKMSTVVYHNRLESNPQRFIISNYPKKWLTHYFREKYQQIDPVLNQALPILGAVDWSQITGSDDLTRKQNRLLVEARDAGLTDGVTFPILTDLGEAVAISLVPDKALIHGRDITSALPIIHLLSQCFHQKARKVLLGRSLQEGTTRRKSLLSPREIEVLTWIARGKTAWEIAQILNISQKSVDFYTDTAKHKLYAMNRTHAVTKAIMLGLVDLS